MAQSNIRPAQIPPGELLTYYGDLASGALRPEDVRIEALTFTAVINAAGQVVAQTPASGSVQVISRYNLAIRRVRASILNPAIGGSAPSLIRFNIREQGRNFSVFKNPVDFATLVEGEACALEWDGVYITVPGTQLEVEWSIDQNAWAILVGVPKQVRVTVLGDYIACSPTQE